MKSNFMTKGVLDSLSPLEIEIMHRLKPDKKYRSKDIYALIKNKSSKSSISAILDRLYQKGLVTRAVENAGGNEIRLCSGAKQGKV